MGIEFKKKLFNSGSSTVITLPEELQNFLGMETGDIVVMKPEEGKYGKYIAVWKEQKEE